MPFESPWSRIPLRWRWAISLVIGAVVVVLLISFINQHNSNGEVPVSAAKLKQEAAQDSVIVHQEQAPHVIRVSSPSAARGSLVLHVRRFMQRQVTANLVPGPLQRVRCWEHARRGSVLGFHCSAMAADISYPFVAVYTPGTHRTVFCKKVYAPVASENIPVSRRCRL